jgi:uncharacterized repeat protein (TIGR03803 family)
MKSMHETHLLQGAARLAAFAALVLLPLGDAHAKAVDILYSFCSQANCSDGAMPGAALAADPAGNFYGTTASGGAYGKGVVFRLAPDGTETVLHAFTGGSDGASPAGRLTLDAAGNLYGTAGAGAHGQGIVFRLAPDGTETVLYAFNGASDGGPPVGSLILDRKGNLYGVGLGGRQNCFGGCGAVFKVAPGGGETIFYAFCAEANCADGALPNGDLVADRDGNIYGTTESGGANGIVTAGTVFELTAQGQEKVLWSFCARAGCSDGEFPLAGLIRDKSGNLYGTTDYGGSPVGTVFRLAPDGTETVLYGFTGHSDGGNPETRLATDGQGNLYGTTSEYGNKCPRVGGCGTIYKLSPADDLTPLYSIGWHSRSASGLLEDGQGYLYGTTPGGGAQESGTVFRIRK